MGAPLPPHTPVAHCVIYLLDSGVQAKAGILPVIILNIVTTSLIAGRVWWFKRAVQRAFGESEICPITRLYG